MTNKHDDKLDKLLPFSDSKLNRILINLCRDVEIPAKHDFDKDNQNERLIESIEVKNYPYQPIICPHHQEKGISEDCVECQQKQYETYKTRFLDLAKEKGYEHTFTLKAAFDYYSNLITQYRLTEGDELIAKVYPYCIARGSWSSFYISAIQARAFLRFKQGRYQEALDYFEKQLEILGPNEMIYENMALVYSRLGQNKEASIAYARAILLILEQPFEKQKFSTLLMGLSNVLDSSEDSLIVLEQSLHILKLRFDKPHSLMAKALGSMGDLHMKRQDFSAAEKCYSEAVNIFIDTCGLDTPLTSTAMHKYAKSLLRVNNKNKAIDMFLESLKVWAKVDNNSFDPNMVAEVLIFLMEEWKTPAEKNTFSDHISILRLIQNKIENNYFLSNDINTLCLLKFIYELYIIKGDFACAEKCCLSFKNGLNKLDIENLGENIKYRDKLLEETETLLKLLETIPKQ